MLDSLFAVGDKTFCKLALVGKLADIECEVHGKLLHVVEGRLAPAEQDKLVHKPEQVLGSKRELAQVLGSKRELALVQEQGSKQVLVPAQVQGNRRVLEQVPDSKQVRVPLPGKPDDKLELVVGTLADTEQLEWGEHKPVLGHSKD